MLAYKTWETSWKIIAKACIRNINYYKFVRVHIRKSKRSYTSKTDTAITTSLRTMKIDLAMSPLGSSCRECKVFLELGQPNMPSFQHFVWLSMIPERNKPIGMQAIIDTHFDHAFFVWTYVLSFTFEIYGINLNLEFL